MRMILRLYPGLLKYLGCVGQRRDFKPHVIGKDEHVGYRFGFAAPRLLAKRDRADKNPGYSPITLMISRFLRFPSNSA